MKTNTDGASRDESWFEELFRQHHTKIRAYALRRSPEVADDVVAEVFETAWKVRERVPDDALPWLYRTAANHLLHQHRSAMRRQGREERAKLLATENFSDPIDNIAQQMDDIRRITDILSQLSPSDAELLRLWAWEQLEVSEIAIVLDCSPATARVRLHRARKRCASLLNLSTEATEVAHLRLVKENS